MRQGRTWHTCTSDLVCSIHYVDGLATDENPILTLFLGYESKEKKMHETLAKSDAEDFVPLKN